MISKMVIKPVRWLTSKETLNILIITALSARECKMASRWRLSKISREFILAVWTRRKNDTDRNLSMLLSQRNPTPRWSRPGKKLRKTPIRSTASLMKTSPNLSIPWAGLWMHLILEWVLLEEYNKSKKRRTSTSSSKKREASSEPLTVS